MNPVLIYTDTTRIADEQTVIAKVVPVYQAIYNAIIALNVTPTLAEVDSLAQQAKRSTPTDYIKTYVVNKMLDAAAPYVFNGIPFTRDAVKNMIAVPDLTALQAALAPCNPQAALGGYIFTDSTKGARLNLLTLTGDVISLVADANAQIAALYTYYTKTDASAAVATGLQTVCDALNNFDTNNSDFFAKQTPPAVANYGGGGTGTAIPGLDFRDDLFVIRLKFIQKFEEMGTLFFNPNLG